MEPLKQQSFRITERWQWAAGICRGKRFTSIFTRTHSQFDANAQRHYFSTGGFLRSHTHQHAQTWNVGMFGFECELTRHSGECRPGRTVPLVPSTSQADDPATTEPIQCARLYWPTAARPQVATARLKGLINMLYTRPLEPVSSHSHWWSFCSSLYCARLWPSQSLRSSSRCPLWPERSSLLGLCGYTEEHQDGTRQRQHKHTDTDVWL